MRFLEIQTMILFFSLNCYGALYVPSAIWNKNKISVCFASNDAYAGSYLHSKEPNIQPLEPNIRNELKEKIRNYVSQEFTEENSGIFFEGFEECINNDASDVWIFLASSTKAYGISTFGNGYIFNEEKKDCREGKCKELASVGHAMSLLSMPNDQSKYAASLDRVFQSIVIHEFGHIAGLVHEHDRPEAENDKNCIHSQIWRDENYGLNIETFDDYDYNSIMNYCHVVRLWNFPDILSPQQWANHLNLPGLFTYKKVMYLNDSTVYTENENGEAKINFGLSMRDRNILKHLYP